MVKKSKAFGIVKIVLIVIIVLIIGFSLYSANAVMLTGDMMPMPLGIGAGVVLTGSMEPELYKDDVIIVVKAGEYAVGEVVVYQAHGMLVVHKIVELDGDTVITKGTANNTADDPISIKDIKGKVVHVFPGMGYIINTVKSPIVTLSILALAVWLLILSYKKEDEDKSSDLESIRREIEALRAISEGDKSEEQSSNNEGE